MTARLADQIGIVLAAHRTPAAVVRAELEQMCDCRIAPAANRSVVGVMNEFAFLAYTYRAEARPNLLDLAIRLAATPCSPLYQRHVSPTASWRPTALRPALARPPPCSLDHDSRQARQDHKYADKRATGLARCQVGEPSFSP